MAEAERDAEEPADALFLGSVIVSEWMDSATGERAYQLTTDGDLPLSNYLGLLELAKHELLSEMAGDD